MRKETTVRTSTHTVGVGTSMDDGYMYLSIQGEHLPFNFKLTDENKAALRKVLGPTENWKGIL